MKTWLYCETVFISYSYLSKNYLLFPLRAGFPSTLSLIHTHAHVHTHTHTLVWLMGYSLHGYQLFSRPPSPPESKWDIPCAFFLSGQEGQSQKAQDNLGLWDLLKLPSYFPAAEYVCLVPKMLNELEITKRSLRIGNSKWTFWLLQCFPRYVLFVWHCSENYISVDNCMEIFVKFNNEIDWF